MKIDHRLAARLLMEPVHVLGDEGAHRAAPLEGGESLMRWGGTRRRHPGPAHQATGPVAPTGRLRGDEVLELDRTLVLPLALLVSIIGDAGRGAASGSGQDEQAGRALHERVEGSHAEDYMLAGNDLRTCA